MSYFIPPYGPWNPIYDPISPQNAILDVQVEEQIYPLVEPVSLADAKAYCKIDFDDEDDLITELITVSREQLEEYTGTYFVEKRVTVQLNNSCGGIEIPYGPTPNAIDPTLMVDAQGCQLDQGYILITGNMFKNIQTPWLYFIQMTYSTGYGDVLAPLPQSLILAMKAQIFFNYENRGETTGSTSGVRQYNTSYIAQAAQTLCARYRRVANLLM